jgi:hypothetical protein
MKRKLKSLLDDRRNQLKKYIGTDENNNKHVCAHLNTGPGFPTSNVVVPFFVFNIKKNMKRKLKLRWSTIPPILTKHTRFTSHFKSLNTKKGTTTFDVGNPGPVLIAELALNSNHALTHSLTHSHFHSTRYIVRNTR